jgi:hypothetical protein
MRDPGGKDSDPGWKRFGSWIRDKHPESATLDYSLFYNMPVGVSHPQWIKRGSEEGRQDCSCLPPVVTA